MPKIQFLEIDIDALEKSIEHDRAMHESLQGMSAEKRKLAENYADELCDVNSLPHSEQGYRNFVNLRERAKRDGVYEEARYLYQSSLIL